MSTVFLDILGGLFTAAEIVIPILGCLALFYYAFMRGNEKSPTYFQFVMLFVCAVLMGGHSLQAIDAMVEDFSFSVRIIPLVVFLGLGAITIFFILRDLIRRDRK